jgi:hypothetical protein
MTIHEQPDNARREHLLAAMRLVTLRLRLLQAEVDQVGVFLKNGWCGPDEAEQTLVDLNLLDLAFPRTLEGE